MARRKYGTKTMIALVLVIGLLGAQALGYPVFQTIQGWFAPISGSIGAQQYSRFTGAAVAEDAPSTKIASEVLCAWYDWNGDGAFSFDEVEQIDTAATTGIFTSGREYPIGKPIYLQLDDAGESYETEVKVIQMSGTRNDDGSAKSLGNVEFRATEDSASSSYYGLVGGVSTDDSTDYNYTLNGANEQYMFFLQLYTSDSGFSSQTYSLFGTSSQYSWLSEKQYAPTFIGGYMTNQDAIDLGLKASEWDYYHVGASNTYVAKFVCNIGDGTGCFYDSDATNAPTFSWGFSVEITAAGTWTYIGLFKDVELDDFNKDVWGPTTDATILGTLGADWDWVA